MKIFLDDQFDSERRGLLPEGYVGVRNFTEFKQVLEGTLTRDEQIESISFDNDLGEGEMEGWEIAKWLTEEHPEIFAQNPELKIHSNNPSGRKNLEHYIELGRQHYQELMEAKEKPHPWREMEKKK
jgi:hypothetical protein